LSHDKARLVGASDRSRLGRAFALVAPVKEPVRANFAIQRARIKGALVVGIAGHDGAIGALLQVLRASDDNRLVMAPGWFFQPSVVFASTLGANGTERLDTAAVAAVAAVEKAVGANFAIQLRARVEFAAQERIATDKAAVGTFLNVVGALAFTFEWSTTRGAAAVVDEGIAIFATGWRSGAGKEGTRIADGFTAANRAAVLVKHWTVVVAAVEQGGTFVKRTCRGGALP
jgi:hypothetical protein